MAVSSLDEIKKLAKPLFEQYGIQQAAIFGSFARNENRKKVMLIYW